MKSIILVATLALVGLSVAVPPKEIEGKYNDIYDSVEVEKIINDEKWRNEYFECLVRDGPCVTPDAAFFREILPEAIQTQCAKCTERQKYMLGYIAQWYADHEPGLWIELIDKVLQRLPHN